MTLLCRCRKKITSERQKLQKEIREKTVGYIAITLGLVAGLAWNDAIRALTESLFPVTKDAILAKFIYAAAMTVIVVVATFSIICLSGRAEKGKSVHFEIPRLY